MEVQLNFPDGEQIRFKITSYVSTTEVRGTVNRTVPTADRGQVIATWAMAVSQVGGLWHLEGQNVSIFADGFVVGSPNNPDYPVYTVTNGTITLPNCYGVIAVGLPITCDVETLDIDSPGNTSIADKEKFVSKVTMYVYQTRGRVGGRGSAKS